MKKILIIDDDFAARSLYKRALEKIAVCTESGQALDAIEKFNKSLRKNEHFDLIILDISLPGMNGLEVLEIIRNKEERINSKRGIPIIMISANSEEKLVLEACEKGCNDYLVKPFDNLKLIEKIKHYLGIE